MRNKPIYCHGVTGVGRGPDWTNQIRIEDRTRFLTPPGNGAPIYTDTEYSRPTDPYYAIFGIDVA